MKIPKITVVAFAVFVAISVIFTLLPDFEINSIQGSITTNPDVPSYKFQEAISLWKIYKVTIFQPASYIMYVVTIVLAIVLVAQLVTVNFAFTTKKE